jgi:O2-independent ubiquinone biosynthesis accessory factor UbiT
MKVPPLLAAPVAVVPLSVINQATRLMLLRVLKQHPDLFDRLGEHLGKRYGFVPTDLPLTFVVEPAKPMITVARKPGALQADAIVEGPLFLLLALLEGRGDADALFFSRDLAVTGDMESMMALRNALDDCNINLSVDLSAAAGSLRPLFKRVADWIRDRALSGESLWS